MFLIQGCTNNEWEAQLMEVLESGSMSRSPNFFWHGTGRTQLLSSFFVHMMVRIALDKGNTRRYIACYFWPPLESISPLTTCSPGSLSDSSQAFSPVQSYAVAVMVASAISSLD